MVNLLLLFLTMPGKSKKNKRGLPFEIHEYFKSPPIIDARKIIENMLLAVPYQLLEGLGAVVICDTDSFRENYGDEEKISAARYIVTKDEGLPWIEICLDRLLEGEEKLALKIPFLRDLLFSRAISHEVGHHIHNTHGSEHEKSEVAAERWCNKLCRHYFLRKYWFIIIPLLMIYLPFKRQFNRLYDSLESKSG